MRYQPALLSGRLGGTDFQATVNRDRVTADNLASKPLPERDGESCFAAPGGAENNY